MSSLHIIYASTSGHTDYVIDTLMASLRTLRRAQSDTLQMEKQRAEQAKPEDLLRGDILVLASGSWNTLGVEGMLNPHMHSLLKDRAAAVDLKGKKVALIGLGDDRYHFTVGAMDHLQEFVATHNGIVIDPVLKIINEPYGQEKKISTWVLSLLSTIS